MRERETELVMEEVEEVEVGGESLDCSQVGNPRRAPSFSSFRDRAVHIEYLQGELETFSGFLSLLAEKLRLCCNLRLSRLCTVG